MNSQKANAVAKQVGLGVVVMLFMVSTAMAQQGSSSHPGTATSVTGGTVSPMLVVVKLHSDSCSKCQAMGPILEDLTQRLGADSYELLVKADFTNEATKRQSQLLLSALGLGSVYNEYHNKTGSLLLLDYREKKVVGTLTASQSAEQMHAEIKVLCERMMRGGSGSVESETQPPAPKPQGSGSKDKPQGSSQRGS
jgi:hypothetical protein